MTVICISSTLINVFCLHFGQYNGNCFDMVSSRILLCVFLPGSMVLPFRLLSAYPHGQAVFNKYKNADSNNKYCY